MHSFQVLNNATYLKLLAGSAVMLPSLACYHVLPLLCRQLSTMLLVKTCKRGSLAPT
ncbi:unnamed protein product [Ixodes pacificus]